MNGELMAAEMAEQPAVLARLVERFDEVARGVRAVVPDPLAGIVFVARGSSDNAAIYGRYLLELVSGRPAGLVAPSLHTAYRAEVDYSGYLAVAVSQSGATPEIVTVCERVRAAGARTIAIANDPRSPLTAAAELVVPLDAGPERAVPATKTVTAEFLAVAAIAAALGEVPFTRGDLEALPRHVHGLLGDPAPADALAARWARSERLFVVARGLMLAAALEGALKIKETTSILAEGISSADLRHGPIAAVDRHVPVLVLNGGGPVADDLGELTRRVQERGAPVAELPLPGAVPEALAAIPAIVRTQQLAFAIARERGLDPDAPTGLTKVTDTR